MTEEEYLKISVPNIPQSLIFNTVKLIESVSGKSIDEVEVIRISLRLTYSILSALQQRQDKEKDVPRMFMIAKTVRYLIFTKQAWTDNTSLKRSAALAREAWSKKVRTDVAVAMITMFEGLKELKGDDIQKFFETVEKELATIPVKQDGRGMH